MRYVYDAWDKVKIQRDTTEFKLSRINPFLWRGYIYDYDTGLYYLQSRYYDPELCRFLNPDDPAILLLEDSISPNVYAYCHNDPVNMVDIEGYFYVAILGLTINLGQAIAVSVSTLYTFVKPFRDKTNQLISKLTMMVINSVGYLLNVLEDVFDRAKKSTRYVGNEIHHIVAENDYRAYFTRKLIKKYGVKVSDSYNLVTIKKSLHKHLHTNSYFAAVDLSLRVSANNKKSKSENKTSIISTIKLIGAYLKLLSDIL